MLTKMDYITQNLILLLFKYFIKNSINLRGKILNLSTESILHIKNNIHLPNFIL